MSTVFSDKAVAFKKRCVPPNLRRVVNSPTKMLASRRPTAIGAEDTTFEHMFDDLRADIEEKRANLERLERFQERMSKNEELFDPEDHAKARSTFQARATEYAKLSQEFQTAMSLYKESVADLEGKITRRQQVLEAIDAEVGAIRLEPQLAEYFVKKQAQLVNDFRSSKNMLCATIKAQLSKKTATKPTPGGQP